MQYPYVKGIPGNIKQDNQMIYEVEGDTFNDDTDILFITSYRIFVIEVKAYRGKVKLTNEWTYHLSKADEKSVLCQAEKHARHFYHTFYSYIPDGNPEYIIPLVVFTDKCDLDDTRDSKWKKYIPACILNNLNASVANLDKPLDYKIDISNFHKGIKDYATKIGETFL